MAEGLSPGDLVSIYNFKGDMSYGIIVTCLKRFGFMELNVLYEGRISIMVYDDSKNTINVIQQC